MQPIGQFQNGACLVLFEYARQKDAKVTCSNSNRAFLRVCASQRFSPNDIATGRDR